MKVLALMIIVGSLGTAVILQTVSAEDVKIDLSKVVNSVGSDYVGVAFDSSMFRHAWKRFKTSSENILKLAKPLRNTLLRVGGTKANLFFFSEEKNPAIDSLTTGNYVVNKKEWKTLSDFIKKAGWKLIFDLNHFIRPSVTSDWDTSNVRELLKYCQKIDLDIPYFQVGNEPDTYKRKYNFIIGAARLVNDTLQLRSLLSEFPKYNSSAIVGPELNRIDKKKSQEYLKEFLAEGGGKAVSAVSLHHYYFNANKKGASLDYFTDTTLLNKLAVDLDIILPKIHSAAPGVPVWFTETSSASSQGMAGGSDRYIAGFMWLDKLGLCAKKGLEVVIRQSFFKSHWALLSDKFTPRPDYFLTELYKRLVGNNVFNVASSKDKVRIYASCTSRRATNYQKGALTVYVLNVQNESTTLNFEDFSNPAGNYKYDLYLLTPGDGGLNSETVKLNGVKLDTGVNMAPVEHTPENPITFPAYSFGFVVIPGANVLLC